MIGNCGSCGGGPCRYAFGDSRTNPPAAVTVSAPIVAGDPVDGMHVAPVRVVIEGWPWRPPCIDCGAEDHRVMDCDENGNAQFWAAVGAEVPGE